MIGVYGSSSVHTTGTRDNSLCRTTVARFATFKKRRAERVLEGLLGFQQLHDKLAIEIAVFA